MCDFPSPDRVLGHDRRGIDMADELTGKVIVIIGGTTGLGLSAAKAVVRAGAAVVVVGRNEDSVEAACTELEALAPGKSWGMVADAIDPETGDRAISVAVNSFGGFDGLYHVAGGSGRRRTSGPRITRRGKPKPIASFASAPATTSSSGLAARRAARRSVGSTA